MEKNEFFDLLCKAAAIYLFILAIIVVPNIIEALIQLLLISRSEFLSAASKEPSFSHRIWATSFSASISGVLKFIFYIIIGRNLFNGGSLVKFVLGKKNTENKEVQVDSDNSK